MEKPFPSLDSFRRWKGNDKQSENNGVGGTKEKSSVAKENRLRGSRTKTAKRLKPGRPLPEPLSSEKPLEPSAIQLVGLTDRAQKSLRSWYHRYNELCEYQKLHGHCRIPQCYPPNRSLGTWVNKQREHYKFFTMGRATTMTDEKVELLEKIGFSWGTPKGDVAWNRRLKELITFRDTHGHCSVPTKYTLNKPLGRWISTQRSEYKRYLKGEECMLSEDRVRTLEALGFVWDSSSPSENPNVPTAKRQRLTKGTDPQDRVDTVSPSAKLVSLASVALSVDPNRVPDEAIDEGPVPASASDDDETSIEGLEKSKEESDDDEEESDRLALEQSSRFQNLLFICTGENFDKLSHLHAHGPEGK